MKSSKWMFAFIGCGLISFAGYSQEVPVKASVDNELRQSTAQFKPATQQFQLTDDHPEIKLPKANAGIHYIPVIGSYQNSVATSDVRNISISVDEQNPGKIWIEGLAPEKVYALLKFFPGIYKIPAQNAGDKSLPEGTLLYDDSNKQINVFLGGGYNDANPAGPATIFEPADKKTTGKETQVLSFIGNRQNTGTAAK